MTCSTSGRTNPSATLSILIFNHIVAVKYAAVKEDQYYLNECAKKISDDALAILNSLKKLQVSIQWASGQKGNYSVYALEKDDVKVVALYQPVWFLYAISSNSIIVICIVFWVALSDSHSAVFASPFSRLKHSLTASLILLDLTISTIPVRLLHVVYPLTYGIIYSIFTYVFWFKETNGPNGTGQIYPGLDWGRSGTATAICICIALICLVVQIGLYLIYVCRTKMNDILAGANNKNVGLDEPTSTHQFLLAPSYNAINQSQVSLTSIAGDDGNGAPPRDYGAME